MANDNGYHTRCIIFDDPKDEPNSYELFKEFIEKMNKRKTTGLTLTIGGAEYTYQSKQYQPTNQINNG